MQTSSSTFLLFAPMYFFLSSTVNRADFQKQPSRLLPRLALALENLDSDEINISQLEKVPPSDDKESSKELTDKLNSLLYFQISENYIEFDINQCPLHETLNVSLNF